MFTTIQKINEAKRQKEDKENDGEFFSPNQIFL